MSVTLYEKIKALNAVLCMFEEDRIVFEDFYSSIRDNAPRALRFNGNPVSRGSVSNNLMWMHQLEFVSFDQDEHIEVKNRARNAAKDDISFNNCLFDACKDYMSANGMEYQQIIEVCGSKSALENRVVDNLVSTLKGKTHGLSAEEIQRILSLLVGIGKLKRKPVYVYVIKDDT
ncbi:hypothetical protein [Nitratireductor sp. XY-223]|uniref:hypothetical protein n=1 Tax=Nitratireductor sp. XY-223 TaxID=2561926 RepID=UPI0010A9C8A2|nr:hypothetical protein [Nitratireductor sp. XY-223]